MLGLRGNGITIPPKGALGTLQSIQDLRMDDNNITVVGKDAFGQMRVLSYLSLSGNKVLSTSMHDRNLYHHITYFEHYRLE